MNKKWLNIASGVTGLALLLLFWWVITLNNSGLMERFKPDAAFISLWQLLHGAELQLHIEVSLLRVAIGLFFALLIGVPIGLLTGYFQRLEALTSPAFQFLRMISPLSWMPLAVMIWGVGDRPIWFLLTFAAVWPIIISTASGVRQIDRGWLALVHSLSATRLETLYHIILPAIISPVLTGIRLAIGILWIVLVPCEMLGVNAGLGYFILDTRDRLAYSELMATILLIGILGFLMDYLARLPARYWAARHG
ncbi:ABC transporter permease [[Pantoea] beijingensis]|uniref:ABC transporter permease n=1 Tax=[Pantoea] beijingensis TaxID=1324864 RepID=A0A443IHZ5_9GAMM|nr:MULTISPECIES: ABC transporter permease [Erwiniaceae]RWR03621.1 ABC transporter permease [[Pantoea] beijingensis]